MEWAEGENSILSFEGAGRGTEPEMDWLPLEQEQAG